MNSLQSAPKPKQPRVYTNDNILEALRGLSGGVGQTVVKDVAGKVATDALTSILGGKKPTAGELQPNETLDLSRGREESKPSPVRPEVSPVTRPMTGENAEIKKQIESVRAELKALAKSVAALNTEITKTVNEVPVDPGIYHTNFFERLRSVLLMLREQVDDSRSWLTMHAGRKKKMGYWGMYKKHGTTFGLSNERSLATQAG